MIGKKRIGSKLLSAFLSGTILVSSLGITAFADSPATEEPYIQEADISSPSLDVTSKEGFQVTESGKNVSGISSVENTLYETNPPESLMPDTNNEDTEEKLPSNEETDNQIIEFSQLSEEIREQIVGINNNLEEVILPDYLEAIGGDSNIFEIPVSWVSQPEFDGTKEGEYIFFPVIPEAYSVAEGVEVPSVKITVLADKWKETQKQLWYYELYYQFYDPDGSETDENGAAYNWIKQTHGQGGRAYPDDKVSISHTKFDGQPLDWDAIDGSGIETLGTHYVFDENYGEHRLNALCSEATKDNPLKIYYRANPHTVTYQYEGPVPNGAPEVPAAVHTGYSAPVTVAENPTLSGYTFSGWKVQSPSGVEIEDGKLTMPNKDVVLVGTWKETQKQLWYYELYYQFYDPDGSETDENGAAYNWIKQTYGQGGRAYPDDKVSISHTNFDGTQFDWDAIDGSGIETLGTHYVFDENYGSHRLSALCSEATKDNPLKIYYRATPHTVTYQYDGVVPDGAPEVPAVVHTSYSAPVTIAENPTLSGYTFSGWKVQSPSGVEIEDGKLTMPNKDVVLVGTWKETQKQLWYRELYYQFYDPDGSETDENGAAYNWIKHTHGQGGWAYPNDTVSISHTNFDGTQFDWNAIDGSGKETLGVHYVYNENYGPHRLNALCSEATKDNPLKIYYRATPHTVTYQYDGVVPDGAPEVPAVVHTSYSAPVTIAENPTLSGYTFSGWKVQSPSGVEIEDGKLTMPNKDVVLVGTWNKTTPPIEPTGSIAVTKYVTGNKGDYYRSFPMQVTLHGENGRKINGVYGDMVFTDGVSNFTLKDNESKTANGLPADLEYSVAETDTYGHSVSYVGQTGIIPLNGTAQVTITNHKSGSDGGSNTDDGNNRPVNKPDSQNSGNTDDDPVNLTTETLGSHNVSRLDHQTTSITVEKVWKLDNGRERTDSIRVELLCDGKHYDWVTLCEDNKWSYTWSDLNDKCDWSVREDDVPAGFIAEVTHHGTTWTIINDDKPQKELPVTGQNWVIPVLLGVTGVAAIGYGVYKKKSRGHADEKE